jgi:hypothetical protein
MPMPTMRMNNKISKRKNETQIEDTQAKLDELGPDEDERKTMMAIKRMTT